MYYSSLFSQSVEMHICYRHENVVAYAVTVNKISYEFHFYILSYAAAAMMITQSNPNDKFENYHFSSVFFLGSIDIIHISQSKIRS